MVHLDDIRDILKPIPEPMPRLRKAVHGLVNAEWWYSLKRSLLNHRLTSRALDPCAFVLIKTKRSQRCDWSSCGRLLGRT